MDYIEIKWIGPDGRPRIYVDRPFATYEQVTRAFGELVDLLRVYPNKEEKHENQD